MIPENTGEAKVPEYDVFVSHAWEDKEDFVDEFVDALRASGLRVWYDTSEIKRGDSIRKRIDDGNQKGSHGIQPYHRKQVSHEYSYNDFTRNCRKIKGAC